MQGIWGEIERRDPNPMTSPADIATAEEAYAAVRKETAHQLILGTASGVSSTHGVAAGLGVSRPGAEPATGLVSRGQIRPNLGKLQGSSSRTDKSRLKCSHCGMNKHTKEQCFKIVGYPEWWNDGHKRGGRTTAEDKTRTPAAVGNLATSSDRLQSTDEETLAAIGGAAHPGPEDAFAGATVGNVTGSRIYDRYPCNFGAARGREADGTTGNGHVRGTHGGRTDFGEETARVAAAPSKDGGKGFENLHSNPRTFNPSPFLS
jgi:hypothetical protein